MKYEDFMKALQAEYGGYKSPDAKRVIAYLRKDIDERKLQVLWRYVLYTRKPEYGPPSIAHIEDAIRLGREKHDQGDVYKAQRFSTVQLQPVSDREQAEARQEFESLGGLTGMWKARNRGDRGLERTADG